MIFYCFVLISISSDQLNNKFFHVFQERLLQLKRLRSPNCLELLGLPKIKFKMRQNHYWKRQNEKIFLVKHGITITMATGHC